MKGVSATMLHHSKLIPIPTPKEFQLACPNGLSNKSRRRKHLRIVSLEGDNTAGKKPPKKKEWEESVKLVVVDYDEGKHEVRTEVKGLGKEQVSKRYRKRLKEGRGQHDLTISEVVAQIMKLRPQDDIDDLLNHWAGRFHRKNFPLLIQEICKMGLRKHAERVFNWMKNQRNYRAQNDIYNMLIRLYARYKITDQARGLFFEMQEWRLRDWKTTSKIVKQMEPSFEKLSFGLLNHLLRTIGKCGKVDEMMKIFYKLEQSGIQSTLETYNILLDNLSVAGKWRKCVEILSWLESSSLQPQVNMYRRVLNCLEREGNNQYIALVREKIEKMQTEADGAVTTKDEVVLDKVGAYDDK